MGAFPVHDPHFQVIETKCCHTLLACLFQLKLEFFLDSISTPSKTNNKFEAYPAVSSLLFLSCIMHGLSENVGISDFIKNNSCDIWPLNGRIIRTRKLFQEKNLHI